MRPKTKEIFIGSFRKRTASAVVIKEPKPRDKGKAAVNFILDNAIV
jgi:hypothetical protein